jgi:hypothetical protein
MEVRLSLKWAIVGLVLALGSVALALPADAELSSQRPLVLEAYSPTQHSSTPPVSGRSKLARGRLYVATVRGTVSFYAAIDYVAIQAPFHVMCGAPERAPMFSSAGGSGNVGTDAEFIFALPLTAHSCAHARLPRTYANFQANLGHGWSHPNVLSPQNLVKPSRSHTYEFALTGAGKPVSFRLVESDARDDYGSFRIYLRSAVPADCSGHGSQAFGLTRPACLASTAHSAAPPRLPPVPKLLSIDQAPVARVLRSSDVPARNQEVPSGALTGLQFATLNNSSRSAARAEARLLARNGFRSAAISQFAASRLPSFKSTSVKLGSSRKALSALQGEVALVPRAQAPAGATVTVDPDINFAHAFIVTFTPTAGGAGGIELLACAGNYLYTLRVVAKPDTVSRPSEEQLVRVLLARH